MARLRFTPNLPLRSDPQLATAAVLTPPHLGSRLWYDLGRQVTFILCCLNGWRIQVIALSFILHSIFDRYRLPLRNYTISDFSQYLRFICTWNHFKLVTKSKFRYKNLTFSKLRHSTWGFKPFITNAAWSSAHVLLLGADLCGVYAIGQTAAATSRSPPVVGPLSGVCCPVHPTAPPHFQQVHTTSSTDGHPGNWLPRHGWPVDRR